jgi:uncharacterized protein
MLSFTLHFICAIIVLVGALNWGLVGALNFNLVKYINDATFNNELFEKLVYTLVGVAGLYMLFNRTYYLPFLGKTVMPSSAVKPYEQPSTSAILFPLDIVDKDAKLVVYWAAKPASGNKLLENKLSGPYEAYDDYSNYGVAEVKDGKVTIKIECPQQYSVNKFGVMKKVLPKHMHYRTVHTNGIFSEIRTVDLGGKCK